MGKIICSWSSPRNISTALMYSFAQRKDTVVVDEPFYAYYLTHVNPNVNHPGKDAILSSQNSNMNQVLLKINSVSNKEVIFLKNMTHHLELSDYACCNQWFNIILTRKPENAIVSFSKVIDQPTIIDLGYKKQFELAVFLKKNKIKFHILHGENLLKNPEKELQELCEYADISYSNGMLKWKEGGIKEDGTWAKYWYGNVHRSTGFISPKHDRAVTVPNSLLPLLEECNYFYNKLINMETIN